VKLRSVAAAAAVVVAFAACGGDDEDGSRPPKIELVVQDDAQLLHVSTEGVRAVLSTLRGLGVDRVRITAGWSVLAPAPQSPRKPDFDATDSSQYPQAGWRKVDRAVAEAERLGIDVMIDIAFWAPRWAVERGTGGPDQYRWKPDPDEFGDFAEAVARRYPNVRLWTTWNEPNYVAFLLPQWERRGAEWVPVAAHHYRAMHERAYEAIKEVSEDNRVLIGGLGALGAGRPGTFRSIAPLRFVRELACVDERLRPLRLPDCAGFRPLRADGFSHHPYMHKRAPDRPLPDPDSVGISDLARLSTLLEQLQRLERIERPLPLYVTEFGYETNPPDSERGVSLATQAFWLNQAASIAFRHPGLRMHAQFLLRDVAEDRNYQTGLLLPEGKAKPALAGFALPFWIDGLEAIGRVWPAEGRERVRIEVARPGGAWRPVGKPFETGEDGQVRRRLRSPGVYRLRWKGRSSTPAFTTPRPAGVG
jgi:Cellulase (glycosyl hydrolase family 5)